MSIAEQYAKEMKKKFGNYYVAWTPGKPLKLGDIGILKNNVFERQGSLSESFNITFKIRKDTKKEMMDYTSKNSVDMMSTLSGEVPILKILKDLDADVIVDFTKEGAVLFKANGVLAHSIENFIEIGEKIVELYKIGKWKKEYVVITELLEADSATILISNSKNSRVVLKAKAGIGVGEVDLANVSLGLDIQSHRNMDTKIIATEGLTPLFQLKGIKKRIFHKQPNVIHKAVGDFNPLSSEDVDHSSSDDEVITFEDVSKDDYSGLIDLKDFKLPL